MDREIYFRGKRTDNGQWVEGSLVQMFVDGRIASCICSIGEVGVANKDVPPMGTLYTLNGDIFFVNHATIGQYTGLTDKIGNKIFEGDIIDFTNVDYPDCEIIFDNGSFVCNEIGEDNIICELRLSLVNEVIGNIHDNPGILNPETTERGKPVTPEQLPSIDADLGVQKEAREAVKHRLKHTSLHADTILLDLENLCYNAMMDGIRRGFNIGWRLAEKQLNKRQGEQPSTAAEGKGGEG